MRFIKIFLFALIGITLPVTLSAQTISGKLIDENSQPLSYANVVLLSLPDSAFVSGTISGEDGAFKLEATSRNQILKISTIGYKTVYKPIAPANSARSGCTAVGRSRSGSRFAENTCERECHGDDRNRECAGKSWNRQ